MPGEEYQEIGRAYVFVLGGCLEQAVRGFRQSFDVYRSPEKLSFKGFTGTSYSFDLMGEYRQAEVLIESKGYRTSTGIINAYKEFLAKAYSTSVQVARHRKDYFWFVTNVPFGSSLCHELCSPEWVMESLTRSRPAQASLILGTASLDESHVRSLTERLAIAIFTDSFIRVMGVLYFFRPGDNIWSAIKLIHGGRIPRPYFAPIVDQVCQMNAIADPDRIRSGERLMLPWFGIGDEGC